MGKLICIICNVLPTLYYSLLREVSTRDLDGEKHGWKADNLVGGNQVFPKYGDIRGVWAPGTKDDKQFLEVHYMQAVYVDGVDIYETFHAGGVKRVAALNDYGQWVTLWETPNVIDIGHSRIFSPPFMPTTFKTRDIRIDVDCTAARTWVEIDCILLRGRTGPDHQDGSMEQPVYPPMYPPMYPPEDPPPYSPPMPALPPPSAPELPPVPATAPAYILPPVPAPIPASKPTPAPTPAPVPVPVPTAPIQQPSYSGPVLQQWVNEVNSFSSQYDNTNWAAHCMCGKPRVYPQYGDIAGAWATSATDDRQFAEVGFERPVFVVGIQIYETFHAGGVKRIAARNDRGQWVTLWQTHKVTDIGQARIFSPPIQETSFRTKDIRLDLDCTAAGTWVEIDAIQLLGKKEEIDPYASNTNVPAPSYSGPVMLQWVNKVNSFSSQYDNTNWAAHCMCGKPRVYPQHGDISGAWATSATDDRQFAEVGFERPVFVVGIQIYETFHAGGVKRIAARNDRGQWVTLWQTHTVTNIEQSRIFSPPIQETSFRTRDIRLELDCTAAGTWVEIDAIQLLGKKEEFDPHARNMDLPVPTYTEPDKEPYSGPVSEQWVTKVRKYSSQYDDTNWKAGQLLGKPQVYPRYGDIRGAWATSVRDAKQFAEVQFKKAVYVVGIDIYETFHAGGTRRVAALNGKNQWVTLWKTNEVTDIKQARIFSPPIEATSFKTRDLRIEIDCTAAGTWVEIDAIKLKGRKDVGATENDEFDSPSSDSDPQKDTAKKKIMKKKSGTNKNRAGSSSSACLLM